MTQFFLVVFILLFVIVIVFCYSLSSSSYNNKDVTYKAETIATKSVVVDKINSVLAKTYLEDNEALLIYGEIPLSVLYWSFDINDNSINNGQFQTVYPGSCIAIIGAYNEYALIATKKLVLKNHNNSNPHRRLFIKEVILEPEVNIDYECFLQSRNASKHFFHFYKIIYNGDLDFVQAKKPDKPAIVHRNVERKNAKIVGSYFTQYADPNYKLVDVSVCADQNRSEALILETPIIRVKRSDHKHLHYWPFRIVAVDHFMSRVALHSQIVLIDADTDIPFYVYFTGIISKKINKKGFQTVHVIEVAVPDGIKRVRVLERIYYDIETGTAPHPDTILPMQVYVLNV